MISNQSTALFTSRITPNFEKNLEIFEAIDKLDLRMCEESQEIILQAVPNGALNAAFSVGNCNHLHFCVNDTIDVAHYIAYLTRKKRRSRKAK